MLRYKNNAHKSTDKYSIKIIYLLKSECSINPYQFKCVSQGR